MMGQGLARAAAVSAVLAFSGACGTGESTLRGLLLWPGQPSCTTCRANAIDLMAHTSGPITMVRDSPYTVEAQFDLGGEEDRCIYYMFFSATWDMLPGPPTREFLCTPIGVTVTSQGSTVGATGESGRLRVRVSEFDVLKREIVLEHFVRDYDVAWAPR